MQPGSILLSLRFFICYWLETVSLATKVLWQNEKLSLVCRNRANYVQQILCLFDSFDCVDPRQWFA